MAIIYPLPSPVQYGIASVTWGPATNTARTRNPWTLQDVVQVFDGAMWQGTINFHVQEEADGRALVAWLTALKGTRGTFLFGDPAAPVPLGGAADDPGTPVVDGGGQTGSALTIRGLPYSMSGYLLAGDYFSLGTGSSARLYMCLEDVDADNNGYASITCWPPLRGSPTDGDEITIDTPQGVFALTQNINSWNVSSPVIYDGISLPIAEVVAAP